MKILVTGGAGFIGSNFCFYMTEKYPRYNFVCVDALTYAGNYHTVKPLVDAKKLKFYRADIADRAKMREIFKTEGFDIVVNFAAESHVDKSISNPEIFLKTNILGTQILMDCCREFNVARFHQISTDEVYGDLPLDRRDLFFTEHTPPRPSSPYSASKASADLLALAYYRTYGFPLTISRCSNNYGPFHFPEKLIPLMIIKASYGEKLPIYGKGSNVRDWLYVTDHCSAIDLVIHKGKTGEVYNVGGHNEKSNLEVVKIILAELGKDEELISYTPDRLGHDLRYAVDPTKITNELGWTPKIAFDEGIKKTIRWYLDNKRWWQEILSGEYKNPLEFPYTIRSAQ